MEKDEIISLIKSIIRLIECSQESFKFNFCMQYNFVSCDEAMLQHAKKILLVCVVTSWLPLASSSADLNLSFETLMRRRSWSSKNANVDIAVVTNVIQKKICNN